MTRRTRPAPLRVTQLEDRVTPAVAYALSGVANGTANLLAFDTASPISTTPITVTNLATNEQLVGIDFRPQNGHLYALGVTTTSASSNTGTLYDISVRTGRATPVGGTGQVTTSNGLPNPATAGVGFSFDFNPTADAIRVIATDGDNFVINPSTGTTAANQTAVGGGRVYSGAGYTNNFANATTTTLYDIDAATDSLYRVPNPATPGAGDVLVGALGVDFTEVNGFDIPAAVTSGTSGTAVSSGFGFAALTVLGVPQLYSVNLVDGTSTRIGIIGKSAALSGLAIQNDYGGFPVASLTAVSAGTANLTRFNTSTPGTTTSVAVTGVAASEILVGIDYRPNTGQLYGLGVNTTGTGTLYLINPQSGAVTVVGATGAVTSLPNPTTTGFGFDFNPAVDAIRVVTSAGQNFSISPTTGLVLAINDNINGAATGAVAAAYTNSFGQTPGVNGATTLYVLDAVTNNLLIQNPATGVTTVVAPVTLNGTTLDFFNATGFDIPAAVTSPLPNGAAAAGFAYATLNVSGVASLYRIDLATSAATNLGSVSVTTSALAIGDAPTGAVRFAAATASVDEGGTATVTLTRTGTLGPLTVTVSTLTATFGGTATEGVDYAPGPVEVTFADGSNTATFTVPTDTDVLIEGNETAVFDVKSVGGVVRATSVSFTLTITDTTPPVAPSSTLLTGRNSGLASLRVPNAAGQYPDTPTAAVQPFGGIPQTVRVASGDVNGDGTPDTVVVTGPGTPIRVAVVSGVDNTTVLVAPFDPFGGDFTGGGFVAAGDLDGDGRDEFLVTPDEGGGPRVTVFSLTPVGTTTVRANFLGIDDANFRGGARAATGDINGDGIRDVVVAAGFTGGPRTAIYTGQSVLAGTPTRLVNDFFAFPGTDAVNLRNGAFVAASDVTGDGFADLIFGGGPGGAPRVFILSGAVVSAGDVASAQAAPVANFFVAGNSDDRGGIRVAAVDADGDARADVVVGSGAGSRANVRVYLGKNFTNANEPGTFQDIIVFGGVPQAEGVFVG